MVTRLSAASLLATALYALPAAAASEIKVTLLGTGTPLPSAEQFGPATLVEANGKRLLFDAGRGVVVRLHQASVGPDAIDAVFFTHLHSDHITGFPDLWLSGWQSGRKRRLQVWGPDGTLGMMDGLRAAYQFDLNSRARPPESLPEEGAAIAAVEINPPQAIDLDGVRVSAFAVDHGPLKPALGYRVDFGGRSVVLSGDTRVSQSLINAAKGTDCLIHCAWSVDPGVPPRALQFLTSAEEAGRVFQAVHPRLGVIYHYNREAGLAEQVGRSYKGRFSIGHDLSVIRIGETITIEPHRKESK